MTRRIVINDPVMTQWIAKQVAHLSIEAATSIGVVDEDGTPRGGVLYTDYTGEGGSVSIHGAGNEDGWATRDFFWIMFDYPFRQLGVKKVIATIPEMNERALRLNLNLGFWPEARIADVFPDGEDLIVTSMTEDRCRWLRYKPRTGFLSGELHHGEEVQGPAAT